jgi:RHS repeat-associated protein
MSFGTTTKATYTYDVVNRLTKITDGSNLATSYAYDAASQLTSRTLPNSVVTTYTYDGLGRLTQLKDAKGNTVIANNQYSYNTANQIIQNIDQSGTHVYGYDALDRLTSATYTGTPAESYAYDAVGNRTSSQRSASYSYQPFNRLTGTTTAGYLYDSNGNMISKADSSGTTQFASDFENRLIQAVTPSTGSVTYKYDALGRRIQTAPSNGASTNFTYDGQDVAQDKTSAGVITEYLNGPGIDNKIRQKTGNTLYYFAHDHLGSTTALTDTKGSLAERETYDGYGNTVGSTKTRYGYTGRERDSLTGLMYYRARFYDPQLGRFISEDPIGLKGGVNQYSYAEGDPVNGIDPFGQDVIAIFDRRKGTLTVTDRQTGKRMVIKRVFSGYRGCSNNPSCDAVKDTGPVPAGNYLIGKRYIPQKHQGQSGDYNWYRLYGSNGKGGYSYDYVPVRDANGNTVIRGGFNLHTGSYSEGCVTVESDTSWWNPFTTYPQSDAYTQLRQMLDNTAALTYKGSTYRGRLIVK